MNIFQNYRKVIIDLKNKKNSVYSIIFIGISCILFIIFAVGLVQNPFGPQREIFYLGTDGYFGDFLYMMYSTLDRDPYTKSGYVCYFPLTYMILNIFGQLDYYFEMTYQQVKNSKMAIMSGFFFIGFSVFLLYMSLDKMARKCRVSPFLLISLFLSYPFLFSIERGNYIVLSAASVGFFICYYDSEKTSERVFAAICLALATVLKITPVFFGLLYFEKRQYREIFLSAIIAVLLAFLPFLYFKDGFANIPRLFNIFRSMMKQGQPTFIWSDIVICSPQLSLKHAVYVIFNLFGLPQEPIILLYNISNMITYIMFFITIVFSFFTKNKWLRISLLSMAVLFFQDSGLYCGLYLFPMVVLFFSSLERRSKLFNVFTLIVFLVFLNPYQIAVIYYLNITFLFITIALTVFWLVLLIYSGRNIITRFIKRTYEPVRV
jgi:hypothetical protein